MATTAISTELLVLNTRSADLPFIAGGGTNNAIVATVAADGWVVTPPTNYTVDEHMVFILGSDGSGGTVTFKAGDRVPGQLSDLGDVVITLAANDGRVVVLRTAQFVQSDGTINVIPSTTGLVLTAVYLPRGG